MIKIWETLEEKFVYDLKIFKAFYKKRLNPLSNESSNFVVLKSNNWVNILPITKSGKIVLVEQYRHGTNEVTFELPGGLVEDNENPMDAAMRECEEETGFSSAEKAILTGESHPNPAFLDNKCTSFVWFGCERKFDQNLDSNEVIKVHEFEMSEVKDMILTGKINHSIILTAFFFFSLKYKF